MSREKPKKIKVSVGSRIFDTVNLIFLILLGLTTLPVLGLPGCFVFLAEKLSGDEHPFMAGRMVV